MKTFETFNEAFDYCREFGPTEVIIDRMGKYKLFPSGRADRKFFSCPDCLADLNENIPLPHRGVCAGCGTNFGPDHTEVR